MNRRRFLAAAIGLPFLPDPPAAGPQVVVARPVNAQLLGMHGWASEVIQFDGTQPPPPLTFHAPEPDTYQCLLLTDGTTRWVDFLDRGVARWAGGQVTVSGVAWPPRSRVHHRARPDDHG